MVRKLASVLRSLLFYPVFYIGSVPYVLSALAVMNVSVPKLRWIVREWSRWHRLCCRFILGIKVELQDPAFRSGVLYAVKHEAFFEAMDMPWLFLNPVVFAKVELLSIPGWGPAGARFGLIGVDRDGGARALRAMLTEARQRIAEGRPLVIFPEGTRIPHGEQRDLQSGFAGIYKLLGLPVIPIAVDTGPLYHHRWKQSGTVRYRFGEEIPPGLPRTEIEARVQAAINALNT